jgi:predicted nucleic acid-binding protein
MIVVDTNIIAYLYLESGRSMQSEQALKKDPQWAAPLLWRSELRNVLALYLRKDILALEAIQRIMSEAMLLMKGREYEVASLQVLELVASSSCSAYDCEFVALAKNLGTPLVTVDKKILREFPTIAVSLDKFVTL